MKIEAETFMDYLDSALSESDRHTFAALIAEDASLQREERAYRRLHAAERLAESEADSLPPTFEHAVMRRVRVAEPPHDNSALHAMLTALSSLLSGFALRPQLTASLSLAFLALTVTPLVVLHGGNVSDEAIPSKDLYDPSREQPYMRLVNAVTARIPEDFRAVSIDVSGWAVPGDKVDLMWLYQEQKKSTISLIARDVQVLSVERENETPSDGPRQSTVTLLVPAADPGKIPLAASTGKLALSIRTPSGDRQMTAPAPLSAVSDTASQPELDFLGPGGQVERYILRDGRLVPRV